MTLMAGRFAMDSELRGPAHGGRLPRILRWGDPLGGSPGKEFAMSGIVVGVDGSPASEMALEWAMKAAVAMRLPLEVLAVHQVLRGQWSDTPIAYPEGEDTLDEPRRIADEMVHRVAGKVPERPLSVTVKVLNGLPASELVDMSKDADLIVVGSRGRGGFTRLLMGSVSAHVVNHAFCPVVAIPSER